MPYPWRQRIRAETFLHGASSSTHLQASYVNLGNRCLPICIESGVFGAVVALAFVGSIPINRPKETSVTIQKGKITSFIGPNGAGKSTLLSIMSRLIKKDSGEIYIDGQEIGACDSKELAKKMSILKQANQINIRLTIKDLVSFGRFPYSQGRLTEETGFISTRRLAI